MNSINIGPVVDGSESFVLCELLHKKSRGDDLDFSLYVCRDNQQLDKVAKELNFFATDFVEILTFPEKTTPVYDDSSAENYSISMARISTLIKIQEAKENVAGKKSKCKDKSKDGNKEKKSVIILATLRSLLEKIAQPFSYGKELLREIKLGQEIDLNQFINGLQSLAYERVATVRQVGEFSIRGGIIDICTNEDFGYRIDLFGDEVESIRKFDLISQISNQDCSVDRFCLQPIFEKQVNIHNLKDSYSLIDILKDKQSIIRIIKGKDIDLGAFYEKVKESYNLRKALLEDEGKNPFELIAPDDLFVSVDDDIFDIVFSNFAHDIADDKDDSFDALRTSLLKDFQPLSSSQRIELFKNGPLARYKKEQKQIIICARSSGDAELVSKILSENGISEVLTFTEADSWSKVTETPASFIKIMPQEVAASFESSDFIFIKSELLTGVSQNKKSNVQKKGLGSLINELSAMQTGDIVVHAQHGIGKYKGIKTVVVDKVSHDFIILEYKDGDKLFVPVENLELLSRFGDVDEDISLINLDKLGGTSWSLRKAKARKKIKEIAGKLLGTAAKRMMLDAPIFTPEAGAFEEFCRAFPYVETEDQLRCVEDCLSDLQSAHPMDRLICGDVGFGKTEVAMRVAFVVAAMGKKVVVVSPTTILCDQHYQNFKKRFDQFGFNVAQLSRMVKKKAADEIKKNMDNIDILVCTHSAFSKSLQFNNLGLVIIDEEQKFGVEQKEFLKEKYPSTHMLSLSATPIPRTLQMSISGVKPMSIIATPPIERKPVNTFVTSFDSINIREALMREKRRGGQSFVVCPRVKHIAGVKLKLEKIVKDLSIAVIHGQMRPTEIEKVMMDFHGGEYDILLATNIIESGVDIRNVNTIVVYNADMFGLSQLYQIRGRVGRSELSSYAYLCPSNTIITENAKKRLEIIQSLDKLGSSFTLASFDLDMRGAGNLLGQSQSGHVKEVGVELYQHMLLEEIEKQKRELAAIAPGADSGQADTEDIWSPNINIGINIMIPESYVSDSDTRLSLYQRAAALNVESDINAFLIELHDRFGKAPEEVENLMQVIRIKQLCKRANIVGLKLGVNGLTVEFYKNKFANPESLLRYVHENAGIVSIIPDQKLLFKRKVSGSGAEKIKFVKSVVIDIIDLLNK